ncbi:hypothetical protein BGX31_000531 [Mortierella sp. GBA43]|nr:hypothetical protein BGX31_000531 [Mortierella sp. GBA43]
MSTRAALGHAPNTIHDLDGHSINKGPHGGSKDGDDDDDGASEEDKDKDGDKDDGYSLFKSRVTVSSDDIQKELAMIQ